MGNNSGYTPVSDMMYQKAAQARIPISGTFELTPMCNFACKMCYVRKTAAEVRSSPRKANTLQDWLNLAKEAERAGMLYVLLTGGEPMTVPWFDELYEALADMGMLISINTNGSLIDERKVELFRRCPPRHVNITLYGAGDESYRNLCCAEGMYSRVDRAITMLMDAGITVKLNCSLTPYNVSDLPEIVKYAQDRNLELNVNAYMFPPLRRDENSVGQNDRFTPEESAKWRLEAYRLQHGEEAWKNHLTAIQNGIIPPPGLDEQCIDPIDGTVHCCAGKAVFWVTWDGWCLPCGMLTKPAIDSRTMEFPELWQEVVSQTSRIRLSGVCAKCPDVQLCHSCAAMALTETGSFGGIPTYLCETVREMKKIAGRVLSDRNSTNEKT